MEKWACDFCGADMPTRELRVSIPAKYYEDAIEDINAERKEQGEKPTTAKEVAKGAGYIDLAVYYGADDETLECCAKCMRKLLAAKS